MKPLWIGTSWKMNKTRAEARAFASEVKASSRAAKTEPQMFLIPPFPYIADVANILKGSGGQNMHWADKGAWTGEISPLMLLDCGASLVEIGHSERREHFGETDETVSLKVKAAVRHGLVALVCIGDTRAEYDAGRTAEVLERQTRAALEGAGDGRVIIAYEPVWSIGEGGTPADPSFADAQHKMIKAVTKSARGRELQVLYGGSVNPSNCVELAGKPHIDGLFIGRSAWEAKGYLGIVEKVASSVA
jgi:L-erythrulose 1-phosphate isomerase